MADFTLYYTPTSCGAATFITASLAGLSFDSEQISFASKKTSSGGDFLAINPKGNVPAIVIKEGNILLNENIATLTYVADKNPSAGLAPAQGSIERYQYLNVISFLATEMHQSHGVLFGPLDDAAKAAAKEKIKQKVEIFTDQFLKDQPFVMGDTPCAADIYAYIILSWGAFVGIDHSDEAVAFFARVKDFPGVAEAHAAMDKAPAAK